MQRQGILDVRQVWRNIDFTMSRITAFGMDWMCIKYNSQPESGYIFLALEGSPCYQVADDAQTWSHTKCLLWTHRQTDHSDGVT